MQSWILETQTLDMLVKCEPPASAAFNGHEHTKFNSNPWNKDGLAICNGYDLVLGQIATIILRVYAVPKNNWIYGQPVSSGQKTYQI